MGGRAVPFVAPECATSSLIHLTEHVDTAVRVYCISWSDFLPHVNQHYAGEASACDAFDITICHAVDY